MWNLIIRALIKELQDDPERVLDLIEEIVQLLKANPDAIDPLVKAIQKASES